MRYTKLQKNLQKNLQKLNRHISLIILLALVFNILFNFSFAQGFTFPENFPEIFSKDFPGKYGEYNATTSTEKVPLDPAIVAIGIEYCVKNLVMRGIDEADARVKCKAIASIGSTTGVPVSAERQEEVQEEVNKCKEIESNIKSLKKMYESAVDEGTKKEITIKIENLQKSLIECYGSTVAVVAQAIKTEEIVPEEVSKCAKIEIDIENLKKMYENATKEYKPQILTKIETLMKDLSNCLAATAAPTAVEVSVKSENIIEECVKKLIEKNISKEEAKLRCAPTEVSIQVGTIQMCREIEDEIRDLVKKLPYAEEEDKKTITEQIEKLKEKYTICVERPQVAVKPVVPFDPCEEQKFIESSLNALETKYPDLKKMYETGKISKEEFLKYEIEIKNYKERLEKARERCEKREEVKENSCSRLDTLQKIYSELKIKYATLTEEEKQALSEKIAALAEEIKKVEEECRKKKISVEDVSSITEIQKAIETKSNAIIAESIEKNKSREELLEELNKIEEEKKELIKQFTERIKELDARKQAIIEKIKISEKVVADEQELAVGKVKVEVKGKEIEIIPGEKVEIVQQDTRAISVPLEYENGTLVASKSKYEIKVLPSELKEKLREKDKEEIKNISIIDIETKAVYEVNSTKSGRLLWIVPMKVDVSYKVDTKTGEILEEKRPWFDFLVK